MRDKNIIHNRARLIAYKDNKILTFYRSDHDYYFLPGGHVELMEDMKTSLIREAEEELKMTLSTDQLKPLYLREFINEEDGHSIEYFFVCEVEDLEKYNGMIDEQYPDHVAKLVDLDNLPKKLYPIYLHANLKKDLESGEFRFIGRVE
jgi:ADP-ribose pyrophosphatase YjhB (NUDIX family)